MKSRLKAAGIHLCLSLLVALLVLVLMRCLWYPGAYFTLMGGGGLLFLMMGVDVCLGPLLTLAVFDKSKKSLKFDLAVIAIVQLSALLYGAHVMFQARPVFTVFEKGVFKVAVPADFSDSKELELAKKPEWRHLSLTGPILVAADIPSDMSAEDKNKLTFAGVAGADWNVFPKLYVTYDSQRQAALKKALPLAKLKNKNIENSRLIDAFLAKQAKADTTFVYLPILARANEMSVMLDAKTGDFIDIIDAK